MQQNRFLSALTFFTLLGGGISLYLLGVIRSADTTIRDHAFLFSPGLFLLFLAASCGALLLIWMRGERMDDKSLDDDHRRGPFDSLLPFLPLTFLWTTPMLFTQYLDRGDLQDRLSILLLAVALVSLYLKLVTDTRRSRFQAALRKIWDRFLELPRRKKLIWLFFSSFLIYNLCAFILVSRNITFSGDEPYYLLSTHSLYKDGDLNVANNYAQKDYFSFYSRKENPRFKLGMYARAGKKGRAYIYPVNLFGVSVLMVPHYALSQLFSGRVLTFILKSSLSLWAALLGLQVFLLSGDLRQNEKVSLVVWLFFSFTTPILFYSIHLYPEIPIALFTVIIFRRVRSSRRLSWPHYAGLGFLLSTFFWFGLKYNMIFWPLLLMALFFFLWKHRAGWRTVAFLFFPALSLGLFSIYLYQIYGNFSPFAIYEGVMTPEKLQAFKEIAASVPLMLRIDTLFDYFLDQRDGLLLYSPFYVFFFLGIIEFFRHHKRDFWMMLLLGAPFLFSYAFLTHRQGYCPQGRILTPIAWIAAIFIGAFLMNNRKPIFTFLFWMLSLSGIFTIFLLLFKPRYLYQPTTHEFTMRAGDLFVSLSNIRLFLPRFLPSFLKIDNTTHVPNYFWLSGLLAFVLIYVLVKKTRPLTPRFHAAAALCLLLVVFFLWVLFPGPSLYPAWTVRYSPQRALGFYLFPMGEGVIAKKQAEFYLHREKSYKLFFSSRREIDNLKLVFGSEKGDHTLRIQCFDLPSTEEHTSHQRREMILSPPAAYRYKNLYLYELTLELRQHSQESMLVSPYFFQVVPLKGST